MRPLLVATSISMMAAGSVANAADCDYRKNEIDLFTKEKLVTTDSVDMTSWISASFKQIISNRHEMSVRAIGIGEQNSISVGVKLSDTTQHAPNEQDLYDALFIAKDSSLAITLADQSVVRLPAIWDVRGTTRAMYDAGIYVVSTKFNLSYRLDPEAADALAAQDAIYIRIAAEGGSYEFVSDAGSIEFKINKTGSGALSKVVSCLRQAQEAT
jgi:hypothetical protein